MDMVELRRIVKTRFGDDYGIVVDDTDIVDFANEAIREVIRVTKSNILHTPIAYVNNTGILLDNDTVGVTYVRHVATNKFLKPTTEEDMLAKQYDISYDDNVPEFYYIRNAADGARYIRLWPEPTTALDVVYGLSKLPSVVTIATNPIPLLTIYHSDVVNFVLARCHEKNQNYQAYKLLMDEFNNNVVRRLDEANRPEQETYPVIRDDPFDLDWYS